MSLFHPISRVLILGAVLFSIEQGRAESVPARGATPRKDEPHHVKNEIMELYATFHAMGIKVDATRAAPQRRLLSTTEKQAIRSSKLDSPSFA